MSEDFISAALVHWSQRKRRRDRLRRQVETMTKLADAQRAAWRTAQTRRDSEAQDVDRIERPTFLRLFERLRGTLEERLHTERAEARVAELRWIELDQCVRATEAALSETRDRLATYDDVDEGYATALRRKAEFLVQHDAETGQALGETMDRLAAVSAAQTEIEQALHEGKQALEALDETLGYLESAEKIGAWDLAGGGWVATYAKQGKLDAATWSLAVVKHHLERFSAELEDVPGTIPVDIQLGEFIRGADYWLDGMFVDWWVQDQIHAALVEAGIVRNQVARQLGALAEASEANRLASRELAAMYESLTTKGSSS
jgi:hypothetical protein